MYRESLAGQPQGDRGRRELLQDLAVGPAVQGGLLPAQHPLRDGVGADGRRRRRPRSRRPSKLDAAVPAELVKQFPILQPIKAAPTRRTRSSAIRTRSSSSRRRPTMWCWSRRCTTTHAPWPSQHARTRRARSRRSTPSRRSSARPISSPSSPGGCRPGTSCSTAGLVATGRLADATGDLDGAAKAYDGCHRDRRRAHLHRAAVLVLPGAPIAGLGAAAPGQARRSASRRSATRSCASATTAGRSPGWPRSSARRATPRPSARRARPISARGSAPKAGPIWRGFERTAQPRSCASRSPVKCQRRSGSRWCL